MVRGSLKRQRAAGYSVLTLEKSGLAHGTSSKSSKLIHGGLRYLETFDIGLVRESLEERERLLRLAPTLVHRQPFLIPVFQTTSRRSWQIRAGLTLYWTLAGWKNQTGFAKLHRDQWRSLDGLSTKDLQCVWQYWDAQTDDRLLTQAVMRSAQEMNAQLHCPATLVSADIGDDRCRATYRFADQLHSVTAAVVVNAAGPWASEVADLITPRPPTPRVELVQGTHIELPGTIQRGCYYVEAPQDGRAVFVMPWKDRTMVGTTERIHAGSPDTCKPSEIEIEYLLNVHRHFFPGRSNDLIDQWAGLRVLPASEKSANRRSRETQLPVDNETQPRVLSIFGGKLTGYRATAEKVIQRLQPTLPRREHKANTATLRIS